MSTRSPEGPRCTHVGDHSHRRRSPPRTIISSIWHIRYGRSMIPLRPSYRRWGTVRTTPSSSTCRTTGSSTASTVGSARTMRGKSPCGSPWSIPISRPPAGFAVLRHRRAGTERRCGFDDRRRRRYLWAADGHSLAPLLTRVESKQCPLRRVDERCRADTRGQPLCSGTSFDGDTTWPSGYQGVVTERFKYVEYDDGTRQLIDLKKDPHELVNLIAVPRFRPTIVRLRAQLRTLMGPNVQTTIATGPRGESPSKAPVFTYFSPSRFSTYRCRLTRDGHPSRGSGVDPKA